MENSTNNNGGSSSPTRITVVSTAANAATATATADPTAATSSSSRYDNDNDEEHQQQYHHSEIVGVQSAPSDSTTTMSSEQRGGIAEQTNRRQVWNHDAFSSSSEDDDDHEDDAEEKEAISNNNNMPPPAAASSQHAPPPPKFLSSQSEFDKAAADGVPNRGAASFADPSHFVKAAEHIVVDEAMSAAGSSGVEQEEFTVSAAAAAHSNSTTIPLARIRSNASTTSTATITTTTTSMSTSQPTTTRRPSTSSSNNFPQQQQQDGNIRPKPEDLSDGVLPDVLMTMRQKIESLTLFDSDMMKLADQGIMLHNDGGTSTNPNQHQGDMDPSALAERESLKRSFQQSISAAVLVSLAHKRYERRRLAAMEIEKVVRSCLSQNELERVRAILLLLSDDYVRSVSEDARKGGVVALAACAIGLKKAVAPLQEQIVECRELILTSVLHACQDHSQRVRYYATESLFNVVKVMPSIAVQHFFILFEILRSLYADVDLDVRTGAELLDKKLKEVIVGAINSGSFTADACVPIFARFVYMRNKATKQLTLTWLQELSEKLIGAPILEFLHLLLGGIFRMVADPNIAIRQSALAFLQSVLPKLLLTNKDEAFEDDAIRNKVDFDKILQSLVTTMEHPDPFVRKVAMYWMSRIVKAHMGDTTTTTNNNSTGRSNSPDDTLQHPDGDPETTISQQQQQQQHWHLTPASMSVRNSLPHVLPGILLSIGDTFIASGNKKDSFLPDQTTRSLAEQTNACLQSAVRRNGAAYVNHLDGFIVALRDELDSPSGTRNPPAIDRKPYRMDVKQDGSGIESTGWFRGANDIQQQQQQQQQDRAESNEENSSMVMSRQCALEWVVVLYDSVVPNVLKAEYAREFITPIIDQLVDNPPESIIFKSLEVLARITVPVKGEKVVPRLTTHDNTAEEQQENFPMSDVNAMFALDVMDPARKTKMSRDREVFSALIRLHSYNHGLLLSDLGRVIQFMCTLQPPEFVFVSFALELDAFVKERITTRRYCDENAQSKGNTNNKNASNNNNGSLSKDLEFVSSFVQQMNFVLLNASETEELREVLLDCIGLQTPSQHDRRRARLFHIILHSFAHNLISTISLCLWGGAFRTASTFLYKIDPLEIDLMFLLELDQLVELLERPLFRHLHLRMLECDQDPDQEGSGSMLFRTLKSLLMLTPQSTCYNVLQDRLVTVSRFRQSTIAVVKSSKNNSNNNGQDTTNLFVKRIFKVRSLHCNAKWQTIRADSLEKPVIPESEEESRHDEGTDRLQWLGYSNREEEAAAKQKYRDSKKNSDGVTIQELTTDYKDLDSMDQTEIKDYTVVDAEAARHADKAVPKDQAQQNLKARTTRKGPVNPVGKPSSKTDKGSDLDSNGGGNGSGHGGRDSERRVSVGSENGDESSGWKAYWGQPGVDV